MPSPGPVFDDANRNGIQDPGETPFSGHLVYLFDGTSGQYLATGASDAFGRYAFTGLSDGEYRIEYESSSWTVLRNDWVPTTTGSLYPRVFVHLTGSASADFGWRRIVRSTDLSAPVSVYTGANGLRVESFDDAVTARELYDFLAGGSQVGAEAASTTIRFDAGNQSYLAVSVSGAPRSFTGYTAKANVTWQAWLNSGDQVLFHEYGHAWSLYYACVHQDSGFARYVAARGLTGDARLEASKDWDRGELFAEDYRQLFGTTNARSWPQANTDIPAAADVPGLRDFLATRYTQAPAPAPPPPRTQHPLRPRRPRSRSRTWPSSPPPPRSRPKALRRSHCRPDASVTVQILNSKGGLIRTRLSAASEPAGEVQVLWNRKNSKGQRVKSGTYSVSVRVSDAYGQSASLSKNFKVA